MLGSWPVSLSFSAISFSHTPAVLLSYHMMLLPDDPAPLSSIQCPALVIQAQEDLLVHPKHSESLAQAIPNAKLISFEHAGHGIVRQSNIDLNAVLREHLSEAASASPPPS